MVAFVSLHFAPPHRIYPRKPRIELRAAHTLLVLWRAKWAGGEAKIAVTAQSPTLTLIRLVSLRLEKEGHHLVMLKLSESDLGGLVGVLPGFSGFQHGPNIDLEDESADFPSGFICEFSDLAALESYAEDPRYKAIGVVPVSLCSGGGDGITAFDIKV